METTTTSTTTVWNLRPVVSPATDVRERRALAPTGLGTQGTSVPPFSGGAGSLQWMNKSIVSLPHIDDVRGYRNVTDGADVNVADVMGAPGIRSWSPPV